MSVVFPLGILFFKKKGKRVIYASLHHYRVHAIHNVWLLAIRFSGKTWTKHGLEAESGETCALYALLSLRTAQCALRSDRYMLSGLSALRPPFVSFATCLRLTLCASLSDPTFSHRLAALIV